MTASGFARSDLLPPGTATGYKDDGRSNVFALPVLGSGDGGAHSTAGDIHRFWRALVDGRLVEERLVALATERATEDAGDGLGYGRGIWLEDDTLVMAGGDHGVAFTSRHDRATGTTVSALANIEVRTFARTRDALAAVRGGRESAQPPNATGGA